MAINVTALEHADFVSTQTRQKIHDLTDTPEGPTHSQRQAFADQHDQRNVTKYWPVEVVLEACNLWGIQPVLTKTGSRKVKGAGGLQFTATGPVEADTTPEQEEPAEAPQEESDDVKSPYSDPRRTKVEGGKPAPDSEKARKLAALEALVERKIQEARGKDDEALKDLISGVSEATAGAVLQTKSRELQGMVDALVASLREENEERIQTALDLIDEARPVEVVVKGPKGDHKVEGHTHEAFPYVLKLASARLNVALIGPTGCGKTHLAAQISEALDLGGYATVSVTMGVSESKIVGGLLPIGEGGKFEPYIADFVRLYRDGGVFLADEWDAGDPNVLLTMNQALANGHIDLPVIGRIDRHPDFVMVAALNTFGTGANRQYVGRIQQDAAALDRFKAGQVEMDYDRALEKQIVPPSHHDWLERAWQIRDRLNETRMERNMSTRYILDGVKLLQQGQTIEQVLTTFTLGWSETDRQQIGVNPVPLY